MQLDQLNVVLRPRSAWEAMELGIALVRRHAWAIWKPWLLLTFPLFIVFNLFAWWSNNFGLAAIGLWWLKPAFERIPLYVISRAAFGSVPTTQQTLAAQWHWGWRPLFGYLLWRRLSTARSLFMPVDFLEGGSGYQRRIRRSSLGAFSRSQAGGLLLVMLHFEWMLCLAGIALIFMFIPLENLSSSLQTFLLWLRATPTSLWLATNFLTWAAMTIIGPFYSGAGFGLYLNRRTQLEAWDIEIAFKRMRQRLAQAVPMMLVMLILPFALPVAAQSPDKREKYGAAPLTQHQANTAPRRTHTPIDLDIENPDNRRFHLAVEDVYKHDPKLGSTRTITRRVPPPPSDLPNLSKLPDLPNPRKFNTLKDFVTLLSEIVLWLLVVALVLALLFTHRRWWPWLRGSRSNHKKQPLNTIEASLLQLPEKLPPNILTSARRLWQQKQPRQAIALLYRAALEVLAQRARITLPSGATEAYCLRLAQHMPEASDRELFGQLVQQWQRAAWAKRVPSDEEFTRLLNALGQNYGWRR